MIRQVYWNVESSCFPKYIFVIFCLSLALMLFVADTSLLLADLTNNKYVKFHEISPFFFFFCTLLYAAYKCFVYCVHKLSSFTAQKMLASATSFGNCLAWGHINPLSTKMYLSDLKTHFVPCSKHSLLLL